MIYVRALLFWDMINMDTDPILFGGSVGVEAHPAWGGRFSFPVECM